MIMAEINYLWKCVSHHYYLRLIKKKKREKRDKRRECIIVEDLEKKRKNACDERGMGFDWRIRVDERNLIR